jgi:serine/threonine protein kinase HipA of HipAB toxin-antitoxin module
MHQGNLSFIDPSVDPRKTPLQLSPVYDMLPMAFAPGSSGNMRRTPAPLNLDTDISKAQWQKAQGWAVLFWQNVASDDAVSEAFRRLASQMLAQVEGLTADIQRLA